MGKSGFDTDHDEYLEALLAKYIKHVLECEGSDFLSERYRREKDKSNISDEEWADLVRIAGSEK